jgi:Zn-dependent protease with chaperone function
MDFFARQDQARKKTKLLIFYFAVAVVLIILMVYAIGLATFAGVQSRQNNSNRSGYEQSPPLVLWNPQIFLGASLLTLAVVAIGMAYKTSQLAGGGGNVAESLGGRLVSSNTTDLDERKLLNVVEEMAIASGVPMPQVYVLNDEDGINAFAAGHMPAMLPSA